MYDVVKMHTDKKKICFKIGQLLLWHSKKDFKLHNATKLRKLSPEFWLPTEEYLSDSKKAKYFFFSDYNFR